MATIIIRNLDEIIKTNLRLRAAQHGWSMEQEAREILQSSLLPAAKTTGFAQRIRDRFRDLDLDALPVPERLAARKPPKIRA